MTRASRYLEPRDRFFAVVIDQVIKAVVVATMPLGSAIELVPFLALFHARNDGIAFSMFAGLGDVGLSLLAAAVLGSSFISGGRRRPDRGSPISALPSSSAARSAI